MRRTLWPCLVILLACLSTAHAQWLDYRTPGIPRTPDGKPNLSAPVPRTAEGRPDLSDVWMHEITTADEMKRLYGRVIEEAIRVDVPGMEIGTQHKYAFNILLDFKPDESPMRPAAGELMRRRAADLFDPANVCMAVAGIPLAHLLSEPIKIVQSPKLTMVLYEVGNTHRQIYADGRGLPKEISLPAYYGYSSGHWDGDTFVVETVGFNDKTVLDILGHPHSEALHLTERYRRRDFRHLDVEMTFDDPQTYTRPIMIKVPHTLMADADVFESFCDNEKDRSHLAKR